MELQFKRQYISKKQYAVGEIQAYYGYAMEVIDPRAKLVEGKLDAGESCVMLFGITAEEYAWKDTDLPRLDRLAAELRKNVPADRLLACRFCNLLGKNTGRSARPVTTPSIDEGTFQKALAERQRAEAGPIDAALLECRRLQNLCANADAPEGVKADFAAAKRDLCVKLRALDRIFVFYDAFIKGQWPSIGYDLHVEVFTTRARAERIQVRVRETNGGMPHWNLREVPAAEIEALLLKLTDDGVTALRVDNGFVAVELSLADLCAATAPVNANLRLKLIAEVQFALRWKYLKEHNAEERLLTPALESMLTLRNLSRWQIGNSLLYAICVERGAGEGVLCTAAAAKKLPPSEKARITPAARSVLLNANGDQRFLAVFTAPLRAAAFCERLHESAVPVAMTFDDVVARAQAGEGLVIDPESLSYRLPKQEFDHVLKLREQPPQIVRVKPAESAPSEEIRPAEAAKPAAPVAASADLPDPDAFRSDKPETNAAAETGASEETPCASKASESPKKGFFRKFFGR